MQNKVALYEFPEKFDQPKGREHFGQKKTRPGFKIFFRCGYFLLKFFFQISSIDKPTFFADLIPCDINSCYLAALNVYLNKPYALFFKEARDLAEQYYNKYKVIKN